MLISQLIAKLQELQSDVGDKEVLIDTIDSWEPIEKAVAHNMYVVIHGESE